MIVSENSPLATCLPMAQISPLVGGELLELHAEKKPDIIAAGNFYGTETETIR